MRIKLPSFLAQNESSTISYTAKKPVIDSETRTLIRSWVIHKDDDIIVVNKPPGLSVQGGTKIKESVDDYLSALTYTADESPRLVHRLDKDVSGILVLARTKDIARKLAELWEEREVKKLYWSVLIGVPQPSSGSIRKSLALKKLALGAEVVQLVENEKTEKAKRAFTEYDTLAKSGTEVESCSNYFR
eukprot:TRINITY_DN5153_c0_g1_i4.p1 TRINITY_DN5153_c0_g1~~TRINITY_DN5153_c0_g1_i4.p1  ORF type:complete len:188 (-),score=32.83 TRINITY_DN5153_c0_g1_i4:428-991(-)